MRSTLTVGTLIAGSNASVRDEIAGALRGEPRIDVLASVDDGDLIAAARDLRPDVAVLTSPRTQHVSVPAVALVEDVREAWNSDLLNPGARAYLHRSASVDDIAAAVIAVGAGLVAAPPQAFGAERSPRATAPVEKLTPREVEVLGELARGAATKTIAARLDISEHTVKFHIASIFAKLGVSSRTGAVTQGVRLGLIML